MSAAGTALLVVSGLIAILGALMTIASRRPLRAAVGLLIHIIALAGLFLTVNAQLLAALQLLVYAGAVVVLFVFVIMLIGPASEVTSSTEGVMSRTVSLISIVGLMLIVTGALASAGIERGAPASDFGSVEALGMAIYRQALIPFEVVSITLLIAIVGAIAVARGRTTQEDERIAEYRATKETEAAE